MRSSVSSAKEEKSSRRRRVRRRRRTKTKTTKGKRESSRKTTTTTTTTTTTHPVEQIQNHSHPYVLSQTKKNHLAHVYGIALPAQMDIERQILQNVERLPNNQTVKSKRFGLEILSGNVDRIGFEDYLGQMEFQPEARTRQTTHEVMEQRLGLGLNGPKGK
mmetsp:Transcript_1770/g.5613  ORF Transcript_1770/g.5613 Transcript_1770/m.5613 type:complete len:161 (+) Transcript_1770:509-991(+)